jgi:elongation factor G
LPAQRSRQVVDCFFNPAGDADFLPVAAVHDALLDQVVQIHPALMELYPEQGEAISSEQLHEPFERALRDRHLVPICFTSAANGGGVSELLDVFVPLLPNLMEGNSPLFYRDVGGRREVVCAAPDANKHASAHAFKRRCQLANFRRAFAKISNPSETGRRIWVSSANLRHAAKR